MSLIQRKRQVVDLGNFGVFGEISTVSQAVMDIALRDQRGPAAVLPLRFLRIAQALAETSSIPEAASRSGLAYGTVKVYMTHFRKRGFSNQQIIQIGTAMILREREREAKQA